MMKRKRIPGCLLRRRRLHRMSHAKADGNMQNLFIFFETHVMEAGTPDAECVIDSTRSIEEEKRIDP